MYNFFPGHMGVAGAAVLRFLVYAGAVMQVTHITYGRLAGQYGDGSSTAHVSGVPTVLLAECSAMQCHPRARYCCCQRMQARLAWPEYVAI